MLVPRLETERLPLRGFDPGDFEPLAAILGQGSVLRYFPRTDPWPRDEVRVWMDRLAEHWDEYGFGWFAVEHRADARLHFLDEVAYIGMNCRRFEGRRGARE
jgi:RimJ/RimL family protein N-acetyltransferase